jgi:hypothetical protein
MDANIESFWYCIAVIQCVLRDLDGIANDLNEAGQLNRLQPSEYQRKGHLRASQNRT